MFYLKSSHCQLNIYRYPNKYIVGTRRNFLINTHKVLSINSPPNGTRILPEAFPILIIPNSPPSPSHSSPEVGPLVWLFSSLSPYIEQTACRVFLYVYSSGINLIDTLYQDGDDDGDGINYIESRGLVGNALRQLLLTFGGQQNHRQHHHEQQCLPHHRMFIKVSFSSSAHFLVLPYYIKRKAKPPPSLCLQLIACILIYT